MLADGCRRRAGALNVVKTRSMIRVEADEVTYPLHIILRHARGRSRSCLTSKASLRGDSPWAVPDGLAAARSMPTCKPPRARIERNHMACLPCLTTCMHNLSIPLRSAAHWPHAARSFL